LLQVHVDEEFGAQECCVASQVLSLDPLLKLKLMEKKKKMVRKWKINKDFQDVWTTKLPWAKFVVGSNEKVNMGRCHVYT
jgi:hypothetical protein